MREPLTGPERFSLKATCFRWWRDRRDGDARKLADAFGALMAERDRLEDERDRLAGLLTGQATVTEYGVHFWSRMYGKHHVDDCRSLADALSLITLIRRKVDAGALLVSRQVPAPGPVGEWRAVSPDDAAVAFETAKAGSR